MSATIPRLKSETDLNKIAEICERGGFCRRFVEARLAYPPNHREHLKSIKVGRARRIVEADYVEWIERLRGAR